MKNKNLALVAVLFTISVIMAFANGPAPLIIIDTEQIVDDAVTLVKTSGVAAIDLSNVPATSTLTIESIALTDRVDSVNASFSNDIDVAGNVGAATVNGVVPLTAAEKTQALVGSITVDHIGAVATYSQVVVNGDGGLNYFSVGGGNVWTHIDRSLAYNLSGGATQRIATFTLSEYSGAYIELIGGGIQQSVGSFGVRKTWKIHRDAAGCTVAVDVNTQWGTVGTMGDQFVITAGTTAGEVGLTLTDPGATGVIFYGSLKITGQIPKYPTW